MPRLLALGFKRLAEEQHGNDDEDSHQQGERDDLGWPLETPELGTSPVGAVSALRRFADPIFIFIPRHRVVWLAATSPPRRAAQR